MPVAATGQVDDAASRLGEVQLDLGWSHTAVAALSENKAGAEGKLLSPDHTISKISAPRPGVEGAQVVLLQLILQPAVIHRPVPKLPKHP